jgi:hypothetical protein
MIDESDPASRSRRRAACSPMSRPRWPRSSAARRSISCSSRSAARGGRQRQLSASPGQLAEGGARHAALSLKRGTVGDNVMYFETGQGSRAFRRRASRRRPADARGARLCGGARFEPLLVNSVVGFIGPEYLYDGKQIIRAGLEDHFCGKLLGLPMGCDVCYTNHAEADQDDMDNAADAARRRRRELCHGRSGRGRRDAQLSVHRPSTTGSYRGPRWA